MLAALALTAAAGPAASSQPRRPHPLYFGYGDASVQSEESVRDGWLERARNSGASLDHIYLGWSRVAPKSPPAGFDPSDPGSPGYDWERIDGAVRTAAGHGLRVLLTVASAPRWAEGPERPANARAGTWEPRADAYGAFAQAVAHRYDGSFPDPQRPGHALPRIRFFEAWNEPNLNEYLSPQWWAGRLVAPDIYRKLLNGFYTGVKRAQPSAVVMGGALAPFGEPPGGARTPPVLFLRKLLCLKGGRLRPLACPQPARFDVVSTHPIAPVRPPWEPAASPLDASAADLGRLTRVVRQAERAGTVLPRGRKGLWVSEFWTDTNPPDPAATPSPAQQARWYEQDLYQFWRAGAEAAIEFQLIDSGLDKNGGYEYTLQSGVFFADGRPKPSRTAMRFPFVAHRASRAGVLTWGIAPRPGRVRIQARRGGAWRTLASLRARGPGRPFTATLPLHGRAVLRARIGRQGSLPWRLR